MVASLLKLADLDWAVPDYTTLCRRQKILAVLSPYRRADGPLNLLLDSTGIKFLGIGELQARKHGVQGRRQSLPSNGLPANLERERNRPLNARQSIFAMEYLLDLNATQAAIRAGYSAASAKVTGYKLMLDPRIQAVIERRKAERVERTRISIDRVVKELAKASFASIRHFISVDADGQPVIDLSYTDDDNLDALSEISTETVIESTGSGDERTANKVRKSKIKLHDKIRSLQLLGDHVGAFKADREQTANAFAQAYLQLLNTGSKAPIKKGGGK